MSLDRKLDIVGVVLTLAGVLAALSLVTTSSAVTEGWAATLRKGFGLGSYLFSLSLITAGLWLVLRKIERLPPLAMERLSGLGLLFFNVMGWFHFFSLLVRSESPLELASAGGGGGYAGGLVVAALEATLGMGGAAIALVAWMVIALALLLDVTVVEMVRRATPVFQRLQDWAIDSWEEIRSVGAQQQQDSTAYSPLEAPAPFIPPAADEMDSSAMGLPPFAPGYLGDQGAPRTWTLPPVEQILDESSEVRHDEEFDLERARLIEETLLSFGAPARVVEVNRGPTITQFGVEPDFVESRGGRMRVRVGKITALADDLALALSARTIRIQAPVPGKGFVGIEVPNDEISIVSLRTLIESEAFTRLKAPLRFALGQNVSGHAVAADLAGMPHLLIAGATGSGKSVCVNALICCMLLHNTPDDLRIIMVDPKRVELAGYNGIPHLLAPVVVELERVVTVLGWVTREMDMRYHKLAEVGCRNIQEYNARQEAGGGRKLPYLLVVVDELADLMMLSPEETERTITRLAQLARATGIHLVISTQRPSVDVVTGLIKANFPARIAFAVTSGMDSRVILDHTGAERLLGRGDMLFQAPDAPSSVRLQGVYVSDSEIHSLVSYWRQYTGTIRPAPTAVGGVPDAMTAGLPLKQMPLWDEMEEEKDADPLLNESIDLVRRHGRASVSMLQRRLRIGYTRASRIVETMEEMGIVGPPTTGTGTRDVLDYGPAAPPADD